jgi:hypothetical protein
MKMDSFVFMATSRDIKHIKMTLIRENSQMNAVVAFFRLVKNPAQKILCFLFPQSVKIKSLNQLVQNKSNYGNVILVISTSKQTKWHGK